jgi:glucuronate isomerase
VILHRVTQRRHRVTQRRHRVTQRRHREAQRINCALISRFQEIKQNKYGKSLKNVTFVLNIYNYKGKKYYYDYQNIS